MFKRKVPVDVCEDELYHLAYFIKKYMSDKVNETSHEDLYKAYEQYRITSIQDGWGIYNKFWEGKI